MVTPKPPRGFTIVELLIVIVVIAILAAISIVAYNGVQERARVSTLKSDLSNASRQMELTYVDEGGYPQAIPASMQLSEDIALSLSEAPSGYCINGEVLSQDLFWYYDKSAGGLQEGGCSGQVISGSEAGINPNLVTNTDFSSGWSTGFQITNGRSLSTRAGTAGDPYPNRPVLVLSNTGSEPTAWAVVSSSAINHSALVSGTDYTRSYYVRKTGPYSGPIGYFGVLDTNSTNKTLNYHSGSHQISDSWQQISHTSTALQNAPTSNRLYIGIQAAAFTTSGWTLEMQGFEIREE